MEWMTMNAQTVWKEHHTIRSSSFYRNQLSRHLIHKKREDNRLILHFTSCPTDDIVYFHWRLQ